MVKFRESFAKFMILIALFDSLFPTVLPVRSDSDVMVCLQVIKDLESIDHLCINLIHRIGLIHK